METVAQRVDRLEQVMIELAEQSKITQREVARLSTEMLEFKEEMREFKREMNKRWGELANKMGTLAENIVVPNISGIAQEYFGCKE
jgi:TolA-binding protein